MKTQINSKPCLALVVVLLLSSCQELFNQDDLKQNPNSPILGQVGVAALTTASLVGVSLLNEDTDTRIAGMWAGMLSGQSRQHLAFQSYTVSAQTFLWFNYYNTAKDARILQQKTTGISRAHLGVGQTIEAMIFYKLAALWGDVPYSE